MKLKSAVALDQNPNGFVLARAEAVALRKLLCGRARS
jgi:hypothetical protein